MAKFESPGDLDFLLGYPAERLRLAVLVRRFLSRFSGLPENGFDRSPERMLTGFDDILAEIACLQNRKTGREPYGWLLREGGLSLLERSWPQLKKRFAFAGTESAGTDPGG